MANLRDLFSDLPTPALDSNGVQFMTLPIPGVETHRVGKDGDAYASLLVSTSTDQQAGRSLPPLVLEHLTVQHGLACKISDPQGREKTGHYTLLRCTSRELTEYFLQVGEAVVEALGRHPTREEVSSIVNELAELFRALKDPSRKSVRGLWGELFVVAQSANPELLIDSWYTENAERYDFAYNDQRLEVKSSSSLDRIHYFSLDQLAPSTDVHTLIASLTVEDAGGGTSLNQLVSYIKKSVSDLPDLALKLDRIVAVTLGNSVQRGLKATFDLATARETLAFYSAEDVPKVPIDSVPGSVSSVRFKSNLVEVPTIEGRSSNEHVLFESAQARRTLSL